MNIVEAIASRNQRIHELKAEIAQLEKAARLIGGLLDVPPSAPARVKPPPRVVASRQEKPVLAEAKRKPAPPSKAGSETFGCGHPRTPENSDIGSYVKKNGEKSRNCRTCRIATQARARARKSKVSAPGREASSEPRLTVALPPIAAEAKPPAHVEAAKKWSGTCPMLDSDSGRRCTLQARHEGLHSASGRQFSDAAAVNIAEMGGSVRA